MGEYSLFVKALQQMFKKGTADKTKIDEFLKKKMITREEYDYIVGKEA